MDLSCIRPIMLVILLVLSSIPNWTIATQYFLNIPACQRDIHYSPTRAVTNASKFHRITPILKSLHWLTLTEHRPINYKILSVILITNKFLLSKKLFLFAKSPDRSKYIHLLYFFCCYSQASLQPHVSWSQEMTIERPFDGHKKYLRCFGGDPDIVIFQRKFRRKFRRAE
jgi:hypothetical protein